MTKREIGEALFKEGYNCAQAVAVAFSEELNMDKDVIAKALSGFGGGFGRLREVCGAVSGMTFVLSSLEGYSSPLATTEKMETYAKVQKLIGEFKAQNGTYICAELIGEKQITPTPEQRTPEYYKKRPCVNLVGDACEILENYFNNK